MHQEMIVSIIVRERGDNCDRYNLQNRKLHSPESKEEILEPCAKLVSTSERCDMNMHEMCLSNACLCLYVDGCRRKENSVCFCSERRLAHSSLLGYQR